ncbi:MAG: helix-turn-helix transcriptional regulator [Bacteroidetes bacterium]|nr:helix-turn-helix transcriptional regulator [Bacteroidota bacterium]
MFELSVRMSSKNDKLLKEFGKNLEMLRKKRGLSTRQFADEAEISHSSVGRLEAGLSNPTLTTLIKIADALAVDINTLIGAK